jgi:UPF0716 protein FxsA
MPALVFIIALALPIVDLVLLIPIGSRLGVEAAVAAALLAAILGALIIRATGFSVVRSVQQAMRENRLPVREVIEGAIVVGAGAFLFWPGLLTDAVAVLLLLPPLRRVLVQQLTKVPAQAGTPGWSSGYPRPAGPDGDGPVIEGEYRNVEETPADHPPAVPRLTAPDSPAPPAGAPRA